MNAAFHLAQPMHCQPMTARTERPENPHMPRHDNINLLSHDVIGAAIEVHRRLGTGLLESAYQIALAEELRFRNIPFRQQVEIPMVYRSAELDCAYYADFVIDGRLIVEIKAVDALQPIHVAQLLTYLQLSGNPLGLLINFNVLVPTKGGVRRVVTREFQAPA
jgi:GxxExxY protein